MAYNFPWGIFTSALRTLTNNQQAQPSLDVNGNIVITRPDSQADKTFTTASDYLVLQGGAGFSNYNCSLLGQWSGTVYFEGSNNYNPAGAAGNGNWTQTKYLIGGTSTVVNASSVVGTNTAGQYLTCRGNSGGYRYWRVRTGADFAGAVTAYANMGSGTSAVFLNASPSVTQNALQSVNNNSSANLAAGATFTGAVDAISNYAGIIVSVKADQPLQVTIYQSTNGVNWDVEDPYFTQANIGDSRTIPVASNYLQVKVTNLGVAATTFMRLNTVVMPIMDGVPRAFSAASVFRPKGALRTQMTPTPLFQDDFGQALDTSNRWRVPTASGSGTTATVNTTGGTTLSTGTTANSYSLLTSQPTFAQLNPGFIQTMFTAILPASIPANTYAFLGLASPQAVPTAANPISDGYGFELTTAGKLMAVTYAGGTRVVIADLSAATGTAKQPTDATAHRYFIFFRGDYAMWALDSEDNVVATMPTGSNGPNVNTQPVTALLIAGSVAPASALTVTLADVTVADTTHASYQIQDGTYGWRKAKVDASGNQYHAISSPLAAASGIMAQLTAYGTLKVSPEAGTIFSDTFDSAGFDSVNRWNAPVAANGGTNTQAAGTLTLAATAAASSQVAVSSQPIFTPSASFLEFGAICMTEFPLLANTHRFWGMGIPAAAYTAANPLLNAIGFEIDLTGALNACIYSSGTKIFSKNLSAYASVNPALYAVVYRSDAIYFYINSLEAPVAAAPLIVPDSLILPARAHVINHTVAPTAAPTMKIQGLAVLDSNPNAVTQLSDGNYAWRKATINKQGRIAVAGLADPSLDSNNIQINRYGAIAISTLSTEQVVANATAVPTGYPAQNIDYTVPAGRRALIMGYEGSTDTMGTNSTCAVILEVNGVKVHRFFIGSGNQGQSSVPPNWALNPWVVTAGQTVKLYVKSSAATTMFVSLRVIEVPA
jgi:hypothetical protein